MYLKFYVDVNRADLSIVCEYKGLCCFVVFCIHSILMSCYASLVL